ncbi:MAG: tetratricopeptide repeat-containing sulfotransferase family protein [Isosphaeraceae bacterium]
MPAIPQLLDLAVKHHRAGNLSQAEQLYRRVLDIDPDQVDALHLLGLTSASLGRSEQAVEFLGRAVHVRPDFAEAQNSLGTLLEKQGKLEDAARCYRQALALRPELAHVHNNLGQVLALEGRLTEARACFEQALRLQPDLAKARHNLVRTLTRQGIAFRQHGKIADAIACYRDALRLEPGYIHAHSNLGMALIEQEKWEEAACCFDASLKLDPRHAEGHNGLGLIFNEQGRYQEALSSFRAALGARPAFPSALVNLGKLHEQEGHFEAAETACREALRADPAHVPARCQLAALLRGRLPDLDRNALEELLSRSTLLDSDRIAAHFALAQVHDAQGLYARAAQHSRSANALRLAYWQGGNQSYDPAEHQLFVDRLIAAFTPEFFRRVNGYGLDADRPVFVFGLPRSGTSLIEQILASHSQVSGGGELPFVEQTFMSLSPMKGSVPPLQALQDIDAETVGCLGRQHLDRLLSVNSTAQHVVDKMPDNYLYLGFIATLFPRARLIHCRRDLRDTAVSCWMADFMKIRWASDPHQIATRFREYQRLMAHWREVLPASLFEVQYEELTDDLEGIARRLIQYCGLEWQPACLEFHKTNRPVRTASAAQVRQPLYKHSVQRWKHYDGFLPELFRALLDQVPFSLDDFRVA